MQRKYVSLDPTGVVIGLSISSVEMSGAGLVEVTNEQLSDACVGKCYVKNGTLLPLPEKPSEFCVWDLVSETWLFDWVSARASYKKAVNTELVRRSKLPVQYAAAPFDADATARERITGTINRIARGDGLPANWMGWRDANNDMHWAQSDASTVLLELCALATVIEDREQALLIAAWTHKAVLDSLTVVEDILNYDTSTGWPA